MMWVRQAAIAPVPAYAQVPLSALEKVESYLAEESEDSDAQLAAAFDRFERAQPALTQLLGDELHENLGEHAAAVGYFLAIGVWLGFSDCFGERLVEVTATEMQGVREAFSFDEELRRRSAEESLETDDVVAMGQPHLVEFVRDHMAAALQGDQPRSAAIEMDRVYRLILWEILALSYAVKASDDGQAAQRQWQA